MIMKTRTTTDHFTNKSLAARRRIANIPVDSTPHRKRTMQKHKAIFLLVLLAALSPLLLQAQTTESFTFTTNIVVPQGSFSGISDVRTVASSVHDISSLKVRLKITGQFNGDLYAFVRNSSGFTVLLNRVGVTASNPFGYGDSGFDVTFQAGAANGDIHLYQDITTPAAGLPLTGIWDVDGRNMNPLTVTDASARDTSLTNFNGLNGADTWTLFIADVESGSTNMLTEWGLDISGAASPTLAWTNPAPITYGTALSGTQLNASATYNLTNVPGTFTYSSPAGTVLSAGNNQTLSVTFTPSDTNSFLPATTNVTINVSPAGVTIASGIAANNRAYDATTTATLTSNSVVLAGVVPGDTANVKLSTNGYTANFASAGVGTGIGVTVSGLTLTGSAAANYTLTQPAGLTANITAAGVTISSGIAANNKVYDATTTATLTSNSVVLAGVVPGDTANVKLSTNAYTANFASAGVGTGIGVTVSGLTLTGSAAANYTLTQPAGLTANITEAGVTITSGIAANNKVYDTTTTATLTSNSVVLAGVFSGDTANVKLSTNGYTANFASASAGTGIGVTVSGLTLTGSAAANYTLTQPAGLTANITEAGVTITSGIAANNKVYDTTTTATLTSNSVVLAGVLSGDTANVKLSTNGYTANFASASAGTGIGVTVSGLTLTGSAAANYTLTQPAGLTANITAAGVTISSGIAANNKVYDATTTATLTSNSVVLAGVVPGDTANVKLSTNGYTANFASASAGTGIGVTVSGLTLTGSAAANYTLTQPAGLTANITAASTLNVVISSLNPALPGSSVTFTATLSVVAPGNGTPTGNVVFKDGTTPLSTNALNGSAVAAFSTTALSQGSHTIIAEYAGNGNFLGSTNSVSPNQIINTPPVATNAAIFRNPLSGTKIPVAALLTNASSPSGDTLTLTVSPASASNATVTIRGGWVFYTPLAGFTNADSFTYTVTDNYGGSATATITVAIQVDNNQSPNLVITALGGNQYLIVGCGIPGYAYRLQYSDLSAPFTWQDFVGVSLTADSTGRFSYTDTNTSLTRCYRSVYP
jgi:hypothetical protein